MEPWSKKEHSLIIKKSRKIKETEEDRKSPDKIIEKLKKESIKKVGKSEKKAEKSDRRENRANQFTALSAEITEKEAVLPKHYKDGCSLCLAEKFEIIKADETRLLNKRTELVSNCQHENCLFPCKFPSTMLLTGFPDSPGNLIFLLFFLTFLTCFNALSFPDFSIFLDLTDPPTFFLLFCFWLIFMNFRFFFCFAIPC